MCDAMLTFAMHHYVLVGTLALLAGIALNLAFTAGPEIIRELRINKLF